MVRRLLWVLLVAGAGAGAGPCTTARAEAMDPAAELHAQRRVIGCLLPTRRTDAAAQRERTQRIVAELSRRLTGDASPAALEIVDLRPRLDRAQAQFRAGALDAAAPSFDAAIDDGARHVDRLADPAGFVTAHVTRAAIAFARGEDERARELLARAVRYDPTLSLLDREESPRLQQALVEIHALLGPRPPLAAGDLPESCHDAAMILSRVLPDGALELDRFDDCRQVVSAVSSSPAEDALATDVLAQRPLERRDVAVVPEQPVSHHRTYWQPWLLTSSGLAIAVAGAAVLGASIHEYHGLQQSPCGVAGLCESSVYRGWQIGEQVGIGLLAIGGVASIAGVVWGASHAVRARRAATPSPVTADHRGAP